MASAKSTAKKKAGKAKPAAASVPETKPVSKPAAAPAGKPEPTPVTPLTRPKFAFNQTMPLLQGWFGRNYMYLIAFAIPVLLTYLAYVLFGIYPFGPESVLVLDLNGQYVYYFEAIRDAVWGDGSIFYNWSRNLSGEYMGIIGYYLASPFTWIVILLPRKMILGSLLIMQLCKLGAASVTFCYYLQKSKGMKALHALPFSVLYSMMAYAVIQLIDPMWLDGIVFLPLICLGVEYLIDDGRKLNYIIPLALMCIANFYIGFMVCIFTGLYFFFYLFAGSDTLRRRHLKAADFKQYGFGILRFGVSTIVALMCAAIMILPVYNALSLGKFEFTTAPDYSFALQFQPLQFLPQLMVAQYDSVNVQGLPEIYCGILTVLMIPLFYLNGKIKLNKKIGYTLLWGALFTSMYIRPVDMMWHGGQMPNWLPFRYSFLFSFVLLCMAATAFKHIKDLKPSAIYGSFAGIFLFLMFILYEKTTNGHYEHLEVKGAIWLSAALLTIYAVLLFLFKKYKQHKLFPILMLCVIASELVYNTYDSMKAIDKEVAYSERKSYNKYIAGGRSVVELLNEHDDGFYRADKTYHRTVNDSLAFGLRGISHSSSVMNTRVIKLIEALGYTCRSYYTRYDGNTPISDSMLGIKYVLDMDGNQNPDYKETFSAMAATQSENEKLVTVYENPDALSIGYMVNDDLERIAALGNDNPFNSQNVMLSAATGNITFDEAGQISGVHQYFRPITLTEDLVLTNVAERPYGLQKCYDITDTGADHTIDIKLKADTDEMIYFFFKTSNERKVNLWLSPHWNEPGQFADSKWVSQYFETDYYRIMRLGKFKAGQELTLRMTVTDEYTIFQNLFFCHFDQALFQTDIDTLKDQQWNITDHSERYLKGDITAEDGQVMMTSIPYEPGWTVKVDGEKVEPVVLLNSLIGVKLTPGTHTVEMSFLPKGFKLGVFLLILGIFCLVVFCIYDRKHNKTLIAILNTNTQNRINDLNRKKK